MESGIQTYKDLLELFSYVVTSIGAIALIYGVFSYNLNKKQLSFAVLESCITRFSEKFASISNDSEDKLIKLYIDFVNEELFYFEQKYIPKAVAYEWIDGMIEFMPIYGPSPNSVLNPNNSIAKIHELNLLKDFQRIRKAFTVERNPTIELIYAEYENKENFEKRRKERDMLIKEIYGNLQ